MTSRLTVVLVLALASRAFAGDPKAEAQAHVHASEKLFQAGKYQDALGELTTAYALDPQPGLLYAIAQVHVKLGECAEAITWYQRFLDTHPDDRPAKAANSYARNHELVEDGHSQRQWAVIAGTGGVMLVGGGLAYYFLHVRKQEPDVMVSPTTNGGVVTWSGRF